MVKSVVTTFVLINQQLKFKTQKQVESKGQHPKCQRSVLCTHTPWKETAKFPLVSQIGKKAKKVIVVKHFKDHLIDHLNIFLILLIYSMWKIYIKWYFVTIVFTWVKHVLLFCQKMKRTVHISQFSSPPMEHHPLWSGTPMYATQVA